MNIFGLDFIVLGLDAGKTLPTQYNYLIVLLSYVVACIGALAGLSTVPPILYAENKKAKQIWHILGALAMGIAVWSMHFVGMLAFTLPVKIHHDLFLTIISILPAILASYFALYFFTQKDSTVLKLIFSGVILGLGIGAMHYVGMEAMYGDFILRYNIFIFAGSIVVAVILATISLIVGKQKISNLATSTLDLFFPAAIIGMSITGMHYMGMQASVFIPTPVEHAVNTTMSHQVITIIIISATLLLSSLAIISSVVQRMFQELINARTLAEESSDAKSEFLARMSHEIRTPMNAVIGMTRLVMSTELTPKQADYLTKINLSANNLLSVINDILDFSKIEAGKVSIELVTFSIPELLQNILYEHRENAENKGLDINLQIESDIPVNIQGDPIRIGQVLSNLISNAIKFTEKGSISISAKVISHVDKHFTILISVSDTGIGLSEVERDKLFNSFTQADESITRKFGGTGLGLVICRQLCELMMGKIWIESIKGKGSTFNFTIQTEIDVDADRERNQLNTFNDRRALVIDDQEYDVMKQMELLVGFGFKVKTAMSGKEGISILKTANEEGEHYDLVLTDWRMPESDGIAVAREITCNKKINHKPVIFLTTAYGQTELRQLVDDTNLDGYLLKPVNKNVLFDTIVNVFYKKGIIEEDHISIQSDLESSLGNRERSTLENFKATCGMKALIVEDNLFNQQVASDTLEALNIISEIANNGEECLELLSKNDYDIVFMDIQMPVMDGITATKEIRSRWPERQIPIIAMTAHAMTGDMEKSLDAGMNQHISKPFELNELVEVIRQWMIGAEQGNKKIQDHKNTELINGMDTAALFKQYNNDDIRLHQILTVFNSSFVTDKKTMTQLFDENDFDDAEYLSHSIIPASIHLGATMLAGSAKSIETALKANNIDIAKKHIKCFDTELIQVTNDINRILSQHTTSDAPLKFDKELAHATLKELIDLLENDDYRSEDVANKFVIHMGYLASTKDMEKFIETIHSTDYESALQSLAAVKLLLEISSGSS